MRHGKKFNHLGRTPSHRKAMLSNMASSLIMHKRITTTIAKAKALRLYVEPLLTKSKNDSTHSRRVVFSYLQNKESVTELFREVAPKIADRPGGYTRIIRTGYRLGDNAEMCIIELVDFNELYVNEKAKKNTRRSRKGSGTKTEGTPPVAEVETVEVEAEVVNEEPKAEEAKVEEPKAEETIVEAPVVEEVIVEEPKAEETIVEATEEVVEEKAEEPEAKAEETPEATEEKTDDSEESEDKEEK